MPIKNEQRKKEAQQKADAKRAGRTRNFGTVIYQDSAPTNWQNILADTHVAVLVSPLHDSDINPDGTTKKPHRHVLAMFDVVKTKSQALEFFEKIGGVGLEQINSLRGYARYLIHADNPEKYQYDANDVLAFGGADFLSIIELPTDKFAAAAEIIEWCKANQCYSFRQLCDYARENKESWWRLLAENPQSMIAKYMKSMAWEIGMKQK